MKKVTGKALSLVLSLALVVSSFPAIFASASTRTASGIVNDTDQNKIYLVNGGESEDAKRSLELNDWIKAKLQTKTRDDVDDVKVDAISHVSGDSLVTLKLTNDDDDAYLKLKSKSVKGTEVVSILYKGTYTDDDGNDYTIKARKNFTVYVYDKDAPVLGEVKDSNDLSKKPDNGKGLDDFETFAKTRNTEKVVGLYLAEPTSSDNATVSFQPIYVITNKNGFDSEADYKAALASATGNSDFDKVKDSAYYLEITDGKSDVHFVNSEMTDQTSAKNADSFFTLNDNNNDAFKLVTGTNLASSKANYNASTNKFEKDASTSNVTFTLKKLKSTGSVSSSSDDKYTFKTKVEKKIDVAQAWVNGNGTATTSYTVKKSDGKTRLQDITDPESSDAAKDKYLDVTDSELVFPADTKSVDIGDDEDSINVKKISGYVGRMSIGEDAHVGSIDIDGGVVEVNGKVGNITTDDKTLTDQKDNSFTDDGSITVKGSASVGDIDTGDADSTADTGAVTINGGTVGAVSIHDNGGKVTIDGDNSDDSITTGIISATDMDLYSDESKVTIAGIEVNDDDGTVDLQGDNLTVKAIDLDSRNTSLQIGDDDDDDKAFTGTLPEIKNASNATLKTENADTKATINGDLNIDTIDMDSDTQVTLTGNTTAATVEGDGTLTVPASKLYVTDSVSSTKLKLSDTTLAVGTTVFKAKADTVSEDDFDCYGFTLSKDAGNTVDTFKIASLKFAGVAISGGSSELTVGQSATYTASAYPNGTTVPTGYTVEWDLDGGSVPDVFTLTTSGNTATVKVNALDTTFASENKTTLTATLYDEDGYESEDYAPATFDIAAVATPAVTSDTNGNLNVAQGATYQFKITVADGSQPTFTVGNSAFKVTPVGKSGKDYFFKITATGKVGDAAGVYVNGVRKAIATITAPSYKVDTGATLSVKVGGTYTFGVTASTKPTFTSGNSSVVSVVKSTVSGGKYLFTVKGVKAGSTGVYVNGVRSTVVTVK